MQTTLKTGAGAYITAAAYSRLRQELVYRRVVKGSCSSPTPSTLFGSDRFLPRQEATDSIKRIFSPSPSAMHSLFYYISGPPGLCTWPTLALHTLDGTLCITITIASGA